MHPLSADLGNPTLPGRALPHVRGLRGQAGANRAVAVRLIED